MSFSGVIRQYSELNLLGFIAIINPGFIQLEPRMPKRNENAVPYFPRSGASVEYAATDIKALYRSNGIYKETNVCMVQSVSHKIKLCIESCYEGLNSQ